jgi:putative hydrolase of the HAD superfamily
MVQSPVLIFDFGNVIAHFDYARACAHYGGRLGLSGEVFLERVRGRDFAPLLKRYESGQMTAEEFSRRFGELAGLDIPHAEFAAAWTEIFWLNEPVARLVPGLKGAGYTLVLGSNTNDLHAARFRAQFADVLVHFDHLVLSYEVGHLKPAPEFYLACAQAAGVEPAACVFIDDLAENVAGARAAGLGGIVYRDADSLVRSLAALGVRVPSPPL